MGSQLSEAQRSELLELDIPAQLGTLDASGFPRITPIWFIWEDGALHMTSVPSRRHLHDLARDSRASICIDTQQSVAVNGVRPNRQIRTSGYAQILPDPAGYWTRRITLKYIPGPDGEARATYRAAMPRTLILLRPERIIAFGTG